MSQQNIFQGLGTKPMPIYPTMGSCQEVLDMTDAQLPITSRNELIAVLAVFRNTLLKEIHAS